MRVLMRNLRLLSRAGVVMLLELGICEELRVVGGCSMVRKKSSDRAWVIECILLFNVGGASLSISKDACHRRSLRQGQTLLNVATVDRRRSWISAQKSRARVHKRLDLHVPIA
jgi:hypothetical protein